MLRNLEKRGVILDTLFILVYGIDCEGGEVAPKDVEVQSSKLLAFFGNRRRTLRHEEQYSNFC